MTAIQKTIQRSQERLVQKNLLKGVQPVIASAGPPKKVSILTRIRNFFIS